MNEQLEKSDSSPSSCVEEFFMVNQILTAQINGTSVIIGNPF